METEINLIDPLQPTPKPKLCLSVKNYNDRMLGTFGWRFLVFLFFSQLLGKGVVSSLVSGTALPLFKLVARIDPATLQLYMMIVLLPWAAKPLLGLASDFVLIGGYNKRGWLLISTCVGTAAAASLFFSSGVGWVFCFCGINFQLALYDLLSEGKFSEIRNEHSEKIGSDINTFVVALQTVGVLIAVSFVGKLADIGLFWVVFLIITVLSALQFGPTILGWMPEHRLVNARLVQFAKIEKRDVPLILVVGFCGISSIVTSLVATFVSPIVGLIIALILLATCLGGSWATMPKGLTQVALYQVIATVAQPSMGTVLDYFYTATPECLENGPNFSFTYYVGFMGIVGTLISLVGAAVYQIFLGRLRVRTVLIITTILSSLAGLSDYSMVTRFNIRLGIDDHWAYLIGEAVLEPLFGMLNWIPISVLISMAVPKGKESTCFAFIAGLSNFSRMVAELSGAIIFTAAGVSDCNFKGLSSLVLLCHVLMPLCVGIAAVFIVENKEQTDKL